MYFLTLIFPMIVKKTKTKFNDHSHLLMNFLFFIFAWLHAYDSVCSQKKRKTATEFALLIFRKYKQAKNNGKSMEMKFSFLEHWLNDILPYSKLNCFFSHIFSMNYFFSLKAFSFLLNIFFSTFALRI